MAGSYAIEAKTTEIEREARALIDQIDQMGGTLEAIESGFVQRQIQDAAYKAQQAIDNGNSVVVGVNKFTTNQPTAIDTLKIDPELEKRQVERVRAFRKARSETECRAALGAVTITARGSDNLVPPIIAAVEARATLGEIADTMRRVYGEHREMDLSA
jgi:methylmalonyl-CoA mutase N-terminal domain/subunit